MPGMTTNDSRPDKKSGHDAAIDVQSRLRIMEKQRRAILEADTDDDTERAMRAIGCTLVATQPDFQRATVSELPETPRIVPYCGETADRGMSDGETPGDGESKDGAGGVRPVPPHVPNTPDGDGE